MGTLALDSDIRSGVTIPIFIIVILAALLRRYLAQILSPGASGTSSLKDVQKTQLMARARALRLHSGFLPLESFVGRRAYFTKSDGGVLCDPPPSPNPLQALASSQSDPSAMFSMLKNQVVFIFLSGGMGYLTSFLFSGYLVAKAPFPLSYTFKSMLQRGIDVPSLDVNYVSSLSWYFFVLLSCTPLLTIIHHFLGDDESDQDQGSAFGGMMTMMMPGMAMGGGDWRLQKQRCLCSAGMPGMPGMGGPDMRAAFNTEKEGLNLTVHRSIMDKVRQQAIMKLRLPPPSHTKPKTD